MSSVWVQHGGVYLPNAKLAASLAGQSVDVLSSRNTGSVSRGRRCNVASGWCTTLRQGGYTNHPPFSLLCCATCYCKSPVQQYVARQQAVNKNNVIHCICHVVAFLRKSEHVYSYGHNITCPSCSTHRSRSPRKQIT